MPGGKESKGAYTRDPCAELHCNETGKPLLLGGGPAEWALNKDNFGARPDKPPPSRHQVLSCQPAFDDRVKMQRRLRNRLMNDGQLGNGLYAGTSVQMRARGRGSSRPPSVSGWALPPTAT